MTERAAALSKSTGAPGASGAPDPLIGRLINDRFKISALIARGGMGKVYRAEQAPLGRTCAVKVLDPHYAGEHDPEFHKRFFLEASIASKLTHPNTVTIFDYGRTADDIYYMAMEYLEGRTLHRAIRDAVFFPGERAAHIARQVCRALREAHSLGVIHRDLKPANIFLVEHGDEADFVKVLDFGLVKNVSETEGEDLTQTGLFMGSPKYMAPEQIRGDRVDARTDIYALGIILYEMVTGKVPFDRPNSVNILMAHVSEDPPSIRQMNPAIDASAQLEDTIARCIAKSPDQRFRSMDEVLAALKRVSGAVTMGTISAAGTGDQPVVSNSGRQATVQAADIGSDPTFLSPSAPSGSQMSTPLMVPRMPGQTQDADARLLTSPGKASDPRGPKGMALVAAVGAIATAAFVGYLALRPRPSPMPSVSVPPAAVSAVLASSPAMTPIPAIRENNAALAPQSAPVKLQVATDPEGAKIREEGVELCKSTPCEIVYVGADADPTKDHRLTILRQGYRAETKTVRAGDGALDVKLSPVPAAPRYVAPAAPASAPKNEAPTLPPGYKSDIPY